MYAIKGFKSKKFARYCGSKTPITKREVALWIYQGCILGGVIVGASWGLKSALNEEGELKNDPYNIASNVAIGSVVGLGSGILSPVLIPFGLIGGQFSITITKQEITKQEIKKE